ncbi:hypothetical protein [Exiguobacterium oxidotolerans]|uniref:Uncharacterized protein n=1 Tax=Exiguobacterium oxidotolerans TaxID=223958 RepID=A0A653I620_9BACL|nr:hypothetical protein [Exiguobacterium oxidotolerans]VWX34399.1 conserved hypothetical protein [Exiguobacterium oxidotolerans]
MTTRLILIEGLPGSGKTSTAEAAHQLLKNTSMSSALFLEGDVAHPADYEGVAYLTESEWRTFQRKHKDISTYTERFDGHYLVAYRKWHDHHPSLDSATISQLEQRDVYELPFELHQSLILKKWEAFVAQALTTDTTYVFECCFLQNPLTIGLIKYDLPEATLEAYIERLAAIIEPLQPILIYVDQPDVEKSFRKAIKERPTEWAEGFVSYYTLQAYGVNRSLSGIGGTITVLQERQAVERQLLDTLPFRVEVFSNEDFSAEARQGWLEQLIQTDAGIIDG